MSNLLDAFRAGYLGTQDAFQRHDFEAAFANLPLDVVWESLPELFDVRRLEGRDEVLAFFRGTVEQWPDFRTEVKDITEPEPGLIRVEFRALGTGPGSGVSTSAEVVQDWDFRSKPLHVRERLA